MTLMVPTPALLDPALIEARFERYWPTLETKLRGIYGDQPHFSVFLAQLRSSLRQAAQTRPKGLWAMDERREQSIETAPPFSGAVYSFYMDRFSGDLKGLAARTAYLAELGVKWLHPLPLLQPREGDSDGGFAVADYRKVDARLGSIDDLENLATQSRALGMGIILDVVCNHTAKEHEWAVKARAKDPIYKDFYITLPDEGAVAAWEADLIDVFPTTAPGSFTYDEAMGGYVWTTFYPFQWDLNYANPAVFAQMLDVLIFLASKGVQGFRLDSAPFLWKRLGTSSRNQPETYGLLEAWRAALNIVAPSVVLLAEAIEGLNDVLPCFGTDAPSCDLAYNNGVMTALWGSLADGDTAIFNRVLTEAARKPARGTWLNYVRCHDDLIWNALSDYAPCADLERWSDFYGRGKGFSQGKAFQSVEGGVPSTNGMAASLCGIDPSQPGGGLGTLRLKLLYGVIYGLEGWPLIYMGDEIGLDDDHNYGADPLRALDGRWLHRPQMDWALADQRQDETRPQGQIFKALKLYGQAANQVSALGVQGPAIPVELTNHALLAFERAQGEVGFLCLANLSDRPASAPLPERFAQHRFDLLTGTADGTEAVTLAPYEIQWRVTR